MIEEHRTNRIVPIIRKKAPAPAPAKSALGKNCREFPLGGAPISRLGRAIPYVLTCTERLRSGKPEYARITCCEKGHGGEGEAGLGWDLMPPRCVSY